MKIQRLACALAEVATNDGLFGAVRTALIQDQVGWRCTQHYAVTDCPPSHRMLMRATIVGGRSA